MITTAVYIFAILVAFGTSPSNGSTVDLIYGYECRESHCVKVELTEKNFNEAISLPVCRMFCGDVLGTLWPKPTGHVHMTPYLLHINYDLIEFELPKDKNQAKLWEVSQERFMRIIRNKIPDPKTINKDGHLLRVAVIIKSNNKNDELPKLTLDTNESYTLKLSLIDKDRVDATIQAESYFGARHGLETLSQLIVYDEIRREVKILADAEIHDKPVYKWRGILLDTSRNFYSSKAIKRTLDAMAMVKLNTFHWHITDSHSFPLELKSQPELFKLGAYSPRKIYTHEDIIDIVEYGRARGIRVMPEFDAPAHVGEGWQHKNMTACFNSQPWTKYCVEPPCGQLDPTVDALYPILEDIYREMFQLFNPDVFHMGGDEVSVNCWNSSENIKNWMTRKRGWDLEEADFVRLWNHFQANALDRVDRVQKPEKIPIILWTSRLTEMPYLQEYLDANRYIIQIWTTGGDSKIEEILKRGFKIIVSNYDALYFDCGGGNWVKDGNNWCAPYIGWQKVYENNLDTIGNQHRSQILGSEAAVWSEQIDEITLDSRLWPRASAMAERLWANPSSHWREAEARILLHREHLVENGISAESLQPEWCLQNQNECPIDAYDEKF